VAIATTSEHGLALLRIAHPSMNMLSIGASIVSERLGALDAVLANPADPGIVIVGSGKVFSAGADIKDLRVT
jgi:enoyl-CoA hydratase/carnithine racemase